MKNLLLALTISTLFFACSDDKANMTTVDENGNIVLSPQSIEILKKLSDDYYSCRETEVKKSDCRAFTSEAICRFYHIEDFNKSGEYIDYREIKNIITGFIDWELLGPATDQSVLDQAQKNANNHIATVAWDSSKDYGHIAIILPGQQKKSGKWGLMCPNSASFFRHKKECYYDKPLSYSFTNPKNIMLYARKG
ncbi:MAG: hypothetical protein KDC84_13445 [Crocinitomicaceae bacterium]|nr:hypothetical protein [Crocinitomicaceae bacterium]